MTDSRPMIAIVGDGGVQAETPRYELAYELGAEVVRRRYRLVTGGRGGVMAAASKGARECEAWSSGDVIALLPGAEPTGANPWADIVIATGLGDLRNGLVARSHAVIGVGGGAGTLSELALAWKFDRLVVAMRVGEGWSSRLADTRIDNRVRYPTIEDDRVFGADDAIEALDLIEARIGDYTKWSRTS